MATVWHDATVTSYYCYNTFRIVGFFTAGTIPLGVQAKEIHIWNQESMPMKAGGSHIVGNKKNFFFFLCLISLKKSQSESYFLKKLILTKMDFF